MFALLAAMSFGMAVASGPDYDLSWRTIDSGGGMSTGGDFVLRGTIGQHDAGPLLAGADFTLAGGFWAGGGPSDAQSATLIDFTILAGTLLDGDLPELENSDDTYIHTRSGFGQTFVDLHKMQMEVLAVTSVGSPSTLDLTIEARIDEPSGLAQIELRNWNTNDLDAIGSYSIGDADQVNTFPGLDASNYVDPGGMIELRVRHVVFVPVFAFTFDSFIDHVELRVE